MPRVRIKKGRKQFMNNILHREGGVASIPGKKEESNPYFNPNTMEFVSNDTPLCTEGPRGGPTRAQPRAMSLAEAQRKAAGEVPGVEGLTEEEAEQVTAAFGRLEHDNDEHWTADGLPHLKVVGHLAGRQVTHAMREALVPELVRRPQE